MVSRAGFGFEFDQSACNSCGGRCCCGESGNIFVTKSEIVEIANFLNLPVETFLSDFCRKEGYRYSIKEIKSDGEYRCLFLSEKNLCEIYEVRPHQCKTFPFWDRYRDGKNRDELIRECPGVILET